MSLTPNSSTEGSFGPDSGESSGARTENAFQRPASGVNQTPQKPPVMGTSQAPIASPGWGTTSQANDRGWDTADEISGARSVTGQDSSPASGMDRVAAKSPAQGSIFGTDPRGLGATEIVSGVRPAVGEAATAIAEALTDTDALTSLTPTGMLVSHSPVAMAKRAGGLRSKLLPNWIRLFISVAISLAWYFWQRPGWGDLLLWLLILSVAVSVTRVATNIVQLRRARIATSRIPLGPAFKIEPDGMVLATTPEGQKVAWEQIAEVHGVDKFFSPGPRFEVVWDGGKFQVPIIELDAAPSTMDSAIRAYSLGRFGLDLSQVKGLW